MRKFIKAIIISLSIGILLLAVGLPTLYFWAAGDLPGFKKLTDYRPPLVTTVYAQNDQVLGYLYREKRFLRTLDTMSEWLPLSFLAAEDSSFYEHEGVDFMAIGRAFVANLKAGGIKQGGSTITQQIIKRLLLSPEKKYKRKIREAILAYRLEKYLTKDEILTIYLNQIYLGHGAYGVEAAARSYFAKHVNELTLAESALLAGLPQRPSRYDPYRNPEEAKRRQLYVLDRMLQMNWITMDQHDEAVAQELVFQEMEDPSWQVGSYYLEEVRRWLVEKFGEQDVYEGGLTVYTACDFNHQKEADKALRNGLVASTRRRGWHGPIRHLEPSEVAAFLAEQAFDPEDLESGEWVQAVVASVDKNGAKVRFGVHEGYIPVAEMHWAREPDPEVPTDWVPAIKDATKVVEVGDVVWGEVEFTPGQEEKNESGKIIRTHEVYSFRLQQEPKVEGALVSMKVEDGSVLAMTGGYSFARSQFNRATQAKRQPGSAFKPIVYSTAIDNGFTPASVIMDKPFDFFDREHQRIWKPRNYENKFYGPTLLRTALAKSRNLVTIRVAKKIGINKIIQRAKALGLEADFPADLSVALGSASVSLLNLCQAYSAFPRGGSYVKPRTVYSVFSAWGEELYRSETESRAAISPQTAYIMTKLLQEVVKSGTGWRAKALQRPAGAKTGTTNDEQDAWFMCFTPHLLTGVYVGFDQIEPMGRLETGSRAASPIVVEYRMAVKDQFPPSDFPQPEGIVMVNVDGKTGLLAGPESEESYFLPFKAGTQPTEVASKNGSPTGSSSSGEDLFKQVF